MTQRTRTLRDYLASLPESGPSSALSRDLRIAMLGDLSALNTATNEHLANMIAGTLKGRKSGNGKPQDLSTQDVKEMIGLDVIETITLPNLEQGVAEAQQAADDAMAMAMRYAAPFASRGDFLAAQIPTAVMVAAYYCADGYLLSFRRDAGVDPSLAAAVTADGACWSPDTICTWDHFGAVGDGVHEDGGSMARCMAWACSVARPGTAATIHYLANRVYLQEAATGVLDATTSINLVGPGSWACTHKRMDYKDRPKKAGRRDWIRCQVQGATFRATGIRFEGEFGDPLVVGGQDVTVSYRFGGGNQFEGLLDGGTTNTIVLPEGPGVIGEDGAYDGHQIQFNSGSGLGSAGTITSYDGETRTATLSSALNGGASADTTSYVQIGGYPHGITFVLQNLSDIEISGCVFTEMRNQIINHTNCTKVRVVDCLFDRCARGGVSGRRNQKCIYARCMFIDCSDDTIFNSQENDGDGASIETLVSDCIVINCMGFRFIGARRLKVSNLFFLRPIGHAVAIGHSSGHQPVNQHAIHVSGIHIVDPLDRNDVAYGITSGVFAPIRILTASEQDPGSDFVVPMVVTSGEDDANDPASGDALITATASTPPDYFQPMSWGHFEDIQIVQTLRPGQKISDWNGKGTFYFSGTLMTNGYIDSSLSASSINCPGILVAGPLHNVEFNNVSAYVYGDNPAILFANRHMTFAGGQQQRFRIDFNRALTGVVFRGCKFSGGSASVQIAHQSTTTNYTYDVRFIGCDFDLDPYHQHPGRSRTGGVVDGGWVNGTNAWCLDIHRCAGIHVEGCTFRNAPAAFRGLHATQFFGNRVYGRVGSGAAAGSWNAGNKGMGTFPADGPEFRYVDMDSDPRSVNYLQLGVGNLTSTSQPIVGWWMVGQRVSCPDPSTGISGWVRLTSGNGHVAGVDWASISIPSYEAKSATILNGASSVTVSHGLGVVPSVVLVTGTNSEVSDAWVSAKTSADITVSVASTVTADRDVGALIFR